VKNYEPKVALPGGVELISIAPKSIKLNVKKTG
jgi:hypothetical protein